MNDERLIGIVRSDPDRGMRIVAERYSGLVYSIVRGRLKGGVFCERDVEECVADTFAELYMDRDKFDPSRGSLKSWAAKLALHNAFDRLRRARREEGKNIPVELAENALFTEPELEESFEREELIRAVERLGKPDREIIVRKYFLGQSSKEIAERLRMTVSNVDTRTHRAINRLRKELGDNYEE